MKRVGNFKEVRGTSASDVISVKDKQLAFGLSGDDTLTAVTDRLLGVKSSSVLVGGFGDDTYRAARQGVTVIMDHGDASEFNELIATGIGINRTTSFSAEIDNRHFLAGDIRSGQYVLVIDWKKPRNRIEGISLSDGYYNYGDIRGNYKRLGGYLGNFSLQRAAKELLDLRRVGLNPRTVNRAIRNIISRASELDPTPGTNALRTSDALKSRMPWEGISPIASQSTPF